MTIVTWHWLRGFARDAAAGLRGALRCRRLLPLYSATITPEGFTTGWQVVPGTMVRCTRLVHLGPHRIPPMVP